MRNIRLILAYDGTEFCGWQRQPDAPSVQACLENALLRLTGTPSDVCGSGRTDAGVHALGQVANFHTASTIPTANFLQALNGILPSTVRVLAAEDVPAAFHARYQVLRKTYRYRIVTTPVCSPFLCRYAYHFPYPLNRTAMAHAARLLEGEHDFTSFAAGDGHTGEREESNVRAVYRSCLLWRPKSSMLIYEVTGKGFLRYMVRNIMGTLIEVGRGKIPPTCVPEILAARDRIRAGPTAPALGLCLTSVEY